MRTTPSRQSTRKQDWTWRAACAALLMAGLARPTPAAESTPHVDLRLVFQQHWTEMYEDPLVLEVLATRLPQVADAEEQKEVERWVEEFAARGFRRGEESKYRLFRSEHDAVRQRFFDIVQPTRYRLTPSFLKKIYAAYQADSVHHDFDAFIEPAWIQFSGKLADETCYQALGQLLQSQGGPADLEYYLRVLYYAYGAYPGHENDLDNEVRSRHLESKALTPETIAAMCRILKESDYWSDREAKRTWMRTKAASRLFHDFTPSQWTPLGPPTVLELARLLAHAESTAEYKPVPISEWFKKMGESLKQNPQDAAVRSLLGRFVAQSGVGLRGSFELVRPQFESDQTLFTALHQSPPDPSPMKLWHGEGANLNASTQMIESFFKPERAAQWDLALWQCLKEYYYTPRAELRDRLFEAVIRPIAMDEKLQGHAVRRRLLSEARQSGSFLTDSHRYQIAQGFLAGRPMTDPVAVEDQPTDVLGFAVDVYGSLRATDAELYHTAALAARLRGLGLKEPGNDADRWIAYVNGVLGEPLELLCHAFLAKTDTTRGVKFSLQTDRDRVEQLEGLLRRIVSVKGILRSQHQVELNRIPVLENMLEEIAREMKAAVAAKQRDRIVTTVRLTLKITVILGDDSYLEKALAALRKEVFGLADDPAQFRELPAAELDQMVQLFGQLHSEDLVAAIRECRKMKYVEMFYDGLYVPLRSTYGFMNKVGAAPYVAFVKEFAGEGYDRSADLQQRWDKELTSLGQIHGDGGVRDARYINAQAAIVELLQAYAGRLALNPWQNPERVTLNRNVNLGVLHQLLVSPPTAGWNLPGQQPEAKAQAYRKVAEVFLDNVGQAERMDKPVALGDPPAAYSPWDFFTFLTNLLSLYEVYSSPFSGMKPEEMYEGSPDKEVTLKEGLERSDLVPRKVDGTLRHRVLKAFVDDPQLADPAKTKRWEKIIELALLLPNRAENHEGNEELLKQYEELKQTVFRKTDERLQQATQSADRLEWLRWLCRLETSVFGLKDDTRGFGYEQIRQALLDKPGALSEADWLTVQLEEFHLRQVNQPATDGAGKPSPIVQMADAVEKVIERICGWYRVPGASRQWDSLSQAIIDLYRRSNPDKMLETLKPEHVYYLWFLTTQCRDVLVSAVAKDKDQLTPSEKEAAVSVASSLVFLHSYFMPYAHGEFSADVLFKPGKESALKVFCMLDRKAKRPLVDFMMRHADEWDTLARPAQSANTLAPMTYERIRSFLIGHNFLPLQLLETSLADAQRFEQLVRGWEVEVPTYNFWLLWKRKDRAFISLENLCGEVFDGVECNRDLLACGAKLTDDQYWEYFFGDMRRILDPKAKLRAEMPQNLDFVVRRFAALPEDPRVQAMRSRLEEALNRARSANPAEGSPEAEHLKRLEIALKGITSLKDRVSEVLGQGYEYFGRALATRLGSPFSIQRACETAAARVASPASPALSPAAHQAYTQFYESGLFATDGFRPEIVQRMAVTFYPAPKPEQSAGKYREAKRNEFGKLLDGYPEAQTAGLAATARKPVGQRTPFEQKYLSAGLAVLQSLFCGEYLPPGQPFIGDVIWEPGKDGKPQPKPLDYVGRTEDVREFWLWVYAGATKYVGVPEIRELFVPADLVLPQATSQDATPGTGSTRDNAPPPAPRPAPKQQTTTKSG